MISHRDSSNVVLVQFCLARMSEAKDEEYAHGVVSKLLELANAPHMKRISEIGSLEEPAYKKARGSVRAEIFTYNVAGTVGIEFRKLAEKRRKSYIRAY